MDWIDFLEWPAMVVTIVAAWMIGSLRPARRMIGFWCFLVSNVLWIAWGLHADAWGLILVQVFLAGMNIRGLRKNEHSLHETGEAKA